MPPPDVPDGELRHESEPGYVAAQEHRERGHHRLWSCGNPPQQTTEEQATVQCFQQRRRRETNPEPAPQAQVDRPHERS